MSKYQHLNTANEILKNKETYENDYPTVSISDAIEAMIEFAKLHVKEALKEVLNNTENWDDCKVIPVEKVLNAYPLENIK